MPFITPPENCTENGVLKPEFDNISATDVHHANASYGRLVWQSIVRHCQIQSE